MREKIRVDFVNYDLWEQQGYIIATEGNVVDYNTIEALSLIHISFRVINHRPY